MITTNYRRRKRALPLTIVLCADKWAANTSQIASFTSMICSTAADRAPRVRRDGRVPDAGQLAGHLAAGLPAVIRGSRSRPVLAPLFPATGAPPGGHSGRRTGLRSPADDGREATNCYLDVNVNRSAWLSAQG